MKGRTKVISSTPGLKLSKADWDEVTLRRKVLPLL